MKSDQVSNLLVKIIKPKRFNYSHNNQTSNVFKILRNFAVTFGIMIFASLLSFFFRYIGILETNIIIAYILGVLLVALQTDGYYYGIFASIIGVLSFNFFFAEPFNTFLTYRPDYPVTFVIMLIAAIITSTLTANAKQEAILSSLREQTTQKLYQISKGLLKVRTTQQIIEVGGKVIAKLFESSVVITVINSSDRLSEPWIYPFDDDKQAGIFNTFNETQAIIETFETGKPVGIGTQKFTDSPAYYLPIKGQNGILGVIGISCFDGKCITNEQKSFLEAVAAQIALALERERLWERQQKSKLDMERERLRGNLLRAISHDLRTPLTGILGATATILDNEEVLDNKVKRELLQGVYEDADWLIHSVENILNLTRIDEGKIEIRKTMEAVEEIVAETITRVKKLAVNHIIKVNIPDDLLMLPMDGTLIEQVLVNLIDNAIRYTPAGSTIEIKIEAADGQAVFQIADNGRGIPKENLPYIFDRFFSSPTQESGRRGTGLGLAICKSIISAHGGEISAYNNPSGGAVFQFELPLKEESNE